MQGVVNRSDDVVTKNQPFQRASKPLGKYSPRVKAG